MSGRWSAAEINLLVTELLDWMVERVPNLRHGEAIAWLGSAMTGLVSSIDDKGRQDQMRRRIKLAVDLSATGWPETRQ
jgi:hypothetical protein